jgi:hypothetical protein
MRTHKIHCMHAHTQCIQHTQGRHRSCMHHHTECTHTQFTVYLLQANVTQCVVTLQAMHFKFPQQYVDPIQMDAIYSIRWQHPKSRKNTAFTCTRLLHRASEATPPHSQRSALVEPISCCWVQEGATMSSSSQLCRQSSQSQSSRKASERGKQARRRRSPRKVREAH